MPKFDESDYTFKEQFEAEDYENRFGSGGLLVFFLSLFLRRDNIEELANDALTDCNDDKKLDACLIDVDQGRAVVAQGYLSKRWGRDAAPANKASDLNTAISWLLAGDLEMIPTRVRAKAEELRAALKGGEIERIDVLYVHNCFESPNVETELATVSQSALALLDAYGAELPSVYTHEYGLDQIEELYRARDRDILVEDQLDVAGQVLGAIEGDGWEAAVCSIEAVWLYDLYKKHGSRLFSANLRDFLPITRHKSNINAGIRKTAAASPGKFWVYNNGITALTQELIPNGETLQVKGISIINGAQTTGALGECARDEIKDVRVLCRFVMADAGTDVQNIIRFNNTQNIIRPSDLRSNDAVQNRLGRELQEFQISYIYRRGGRKPQNAILAEEIAPFLCAFHRDLQTAGRNRREIFESNSVYEKVFNANISAEHLFLVWSLASAIDLLKRELKCKVVAAEATELEKQKYDVLKWSTSKYFVLFVVGECSEEILGRRVANRYSWKCKRTLVTPNGEEMRGHWTAAVSCILPFLANALGDLGSAYDVTRSTDLATKAGKKVRATLDGLATQTGPAFKGIRDSTVI